MNEPMGTTLTFRVEDDLRQKLIELAKAEDRSLGWIVRTALRLYMEKYGRSDKE